MIPRPPRSTPFPTRRSSDLGRRGEQKVQGKEQQVVAQGGERVPAKERREEEQIDDRRDQRYDELVQDRKSTRLNSSHTVISYAVFCLKKKKKKKNQEKELQR